MLVHLHLHVFKSCLNAKISSSFSDKPSQKKSFPTQLDVCRHHQYPGPHGKELLCGADQSLCFFIGNLNVALDLPKNEYLRIWVPQDVEQREGLWLINKKNNFRRCKIIYMAWIAVNSAVLGWGFICANLWHKGMQWSLFPLFPLLRCF